MFANTLFIFALWVRNSKTPVSRRPWEGYDFGRPGDWIQPGDSLIKGNYQDTLWHNQYIVDHNSAMPPEPSREPIYSGINLIKVKF